MRHRGSVYILNMTLENFIALLAALQTASIKAERTGNVMGEVEGVQFALEWVHRSSDGNLSAAFDRLHGEDEGTYPWPGPQRVYVDGVPQIKGWEMTQDYACMYVNVPCAQGKER